MDWVALIFSMTGLILNARKNIWCWPIWYGSNACWIVYALHTTPVTWSLLILQIVFAITNTYGWYAWRKDARSQ